VGESSGGQDHPYSVVRGIAEAAGDPAVELDDAVDRFGAAVVGSAGPEVGQGNCSLQARRVRPRRAISGMGQEGNVASTWVAERSCW
jgi:hypothetical protein